MAKKAAIQVEEQRERKLAAERLVVPWGELRPNDYAFRGWARGGEGVMLLAGCVSNARESWKLRCLLVLIDSCWRK